MRARLRLGVRLRLLLAHVLMAVIPAHSRLGPWVACVAFKLMWPSMSAIQRRISAAELDYMLRKRGLR